MKANAKDIEAVIATNRFGMGARLTEIDDARHSPRDWLIGSLAPITPPKDAPTAIEMIRKWVKYKEQQKNTNKKTNSMKAVSQDTVSFHDSFRSNSAQIIKSSIETSSSINYRLLDFFSNHFSVSAKNPGMKFLAPALDWDAIAPNILGPFSNMLTAAITHPAMLLYLDNVNSIGPHSLQGNKRKKSGLNENLAREILELHTLSVNGNYTQSDVNELAKAITGWSITRKNDTTELLKGDAYIYRPNNHEPGNRYILDKYYFDSIDNDTQGRKILTDLANHPSTALHICTKLAQHFVNDEPNSKLINNMKKTWLKTEGNLKAVMITLIESNSAWHKKSKKYKSPREFLISTYRAGNIIISNKKNLINHLNHLGQLPYHSGSPAGYGDFNSTWNGPDALLRKIEWVEIVSKHKQLRRSNSLDLVNTSLSNSISKATLDIIKQAENQQQAIALLFLSPDFLYR